MNRWWKEAFVLATGALLLLTGATSPPSAFDPDLPGFASANRRDLSILTYNVEGLPWPVRLGRDADLSRIGARLAYLRRTGRQPHVIVLQEAFTPEAKAIATAGGYRYVALGPARDERPDVAMTPADHVFVEQASLLAGERSGKWLDSGLLIASDYPIVAAKRRAFPAFACGGFDCLANKGMLLVRLAVPGVAVPVTVVATHLNSRRAAHTSFARSLFAYREQVTALGHFLTRNLSPDAPFILTGDFNMGSRPDRYRALFDDLARWGNGTPPPRALDTCLGRAAGCGVRGGRDLTIARDRGRDIAFFSPTRLQVEGVAVIFGHDADGNMLSDHIGYASAFRGFPGNELANRADGETDIAG
jgi:endonuclease/exonuclease/phosphatase family metal-dependent hydrolase